MDARTAWDWLTLEMGAKAGDVVIVGHSLGTAIAALLSAQLGREGVNKFDTLAQVPDITAPVLIAHALDDTDISHTHADVLFNALLDPYLPSSVDASVHPAVLLPADTANLTRLHHIHADWDALTTSQAARAVHREKIVKRIEVPHFGVLHEFEAPTMGAEESVLGRRITLLKMNYGEHDIPRVEGVQDAIGRMFGLIP
ncbi:hypothetical protein C0991_007642 [Blastosporella zonata]|nr:hypothetical protein C0991_007642 [Blastosporella zonata]